MRRRLRLWLGSIAVTTLLVVAVGGITRLTHSGLSIVDWQPLVGIVPPLNHAQWVDSFERYQQFPEYRLLRPGMTLDEYKSIFFWEYLHRLLARLIGLIFALPFWFFAFSGALPRPLAGRLLGLFGLGALQGIAGWLMVLSGLAARPSVSHYRLALHLVLAFAIFGWSIWLIRELSLRKTRPTVSMHARRRVSQALIAFGGLLGLQITWGAFVAGLKAGFMFSTFPLMGGALVPLTYFTSDPPLLSLVEHPAGVQWMHRALGTALLAAAFALHFYVRRIDVDRVSKRLTLALFGATGAQYALGVLTLIHLVPVSLAVTHQVTAAAIVGVWMWTLHHVRQLETPDVRSGMPTRLRAGVAPPLIGGSSAIAPPA